MNPMNLEHHYQLYHHQNARRKEAELYEYQSGIKTLLIVK